MKKLTEDRRLLSLNFQFPKIMGTEIACIYGDDSQGKTVLHILDLGIEGTQRVTSAIGKEYLEHFQANHELGIHRPTVVRVILYSIDGVIYEWDMKKEEYKYIVYSEFDFVLPTVLREISAERRERN